MPSSKVAVRDVMLRHLRDGGHLTLFLDYDGTLVPIAPAPDQALPDPPLLELLTTLSQAPSLRAVILSGRPLVDLQHMLPIPGLILGGLYGVEMQLDRQTVIRHPLQNGNRRALVEIEEQWRSLVGELPGFLIEEKGQAVALHARWAQADQAGPILASARQIAVERIDPASLRILDGHRYVEVAPATADKGQTVAWLLAEYPVPRDLAVCFGDDNKDEAAFSVVHGLGGFAIGVGYRYELPSVDERLESPESVRLWLRSFLLTS